MNSGMFKITSWTNDIVLNDKSEGIKINDRVTPISTEYRKNKELAVKTDIFSIRDEITITKAICAINKPKNKNGLANIKPIIAVDEYTPYAVAAVISSAKNILKKTRVRHEFTADSNSASFCHVFDNTLSIKLLF